MLLTSGEYFAFLLLIFFLFWLLSQRRILALSVILAANYFFVLKWGIAYLALIPLCSTLDFFLGAAIPKRRWLIWLSLTLNLGLIASSRLIAPNSGLALPLSLSFYGFQALTYTIDIYRQDAQPATHYLAYLASVSFFPTLLAGPITRVDSLLRQWKKVGPPIDSATGSRALWLIGMGVAKKFLIADYLGENLINRVFDTPTLYSSGETLLAVYGYAFQLYYDFSGYSDIAIGSALLLGFKLPANFKMPYAAGNIADFWRRWHISLSDWLRDYLYFSLPGLRSKNKVWTYVNLVVTMLLGGLWHGFTINFVLWGLIHGVSLAVTRWVETLRGKTAAPAPRFRRLLSALLTFHIVCFAWIFFRAETLSAAVEILQRIAAFQFAWDNVTSPWLLVLTIGALAHFIPSNWYERLQSWFTQAPALAQATVLAALVYSVQQVVGAGVAPFIYSRF